MIKLFKKIIYATSATVLSAMPLNARASSLGHALMPSLSIHAGRSGFNLLAKGEDALRSRLSMIESAEHSLDLQYYMMLDDVTGKILLEAILRAADRGVKVRILVDYLNFHSTDSTWPLLESQNNIEIRVFNPPTTREDPWYKNLADFSTLISQFTRRMHNKILIVDQVVAIAGGRNLADAYFDAANDFNFHDIDVLAVGPIVTDMSKSFETYWSYNEAVPLDEVVKRRDNDEDIRELRNNLRQSWEDAAQKGTILPKAPLAEQFAGEHIPLIWATAELMVDSPSKVDTIPGKTHSRPAAALAQQLKEADSEFIAVTPYLVPGEKGVERLKKLTTRGVRVRILTNSLASIDSVAAHVGYRRYRKAMLQAGVELYELKPQGKRQRSHRFSSSSRFSLHSKIYIMDRSDIIIGSFNLDPRSLRLNTESTLVIHSPELAQKVVSMFEEAIRPDDSYRVTLNPENSTELVWTTNDEEGNAEHYSHEPKAGFLRRIAVMLLSLLPIEDQL